MSALPRRPRSVDGGLQTFALGGTLWALVILVPRLHLGPPVTGGGPVEAALLLLPLATLLAGAARRDTLWLLFAVPASLLPAVITDPRLVGEQVYGFPAFLLSSGALTAYLIRAATLSLPTRSRNAPSREARSRSAQAEDAPTRRVALAVTIALVVSLGALAWWSAFDPELLWRPLVDGDVAAVRPYGRTLPATLAVVCWAGVALWSGNKLVHDRTREPQGGAE